MKNEPIFLPQRDEPHASPLRSMMTEAHGRRYRSFASLAEAQQDPEGIVVLEGDDGGQIYVVSPALLVQCTEEMLGLLLDDLDALQWPHNDPGSARICYESRPQGSVVPGGMGGGRVTSDMWVHGELRHLADAIRAVIIGSSQRLGT